MFQKNKGFINLFLLGTILLCLNCGGAYRASQVQIMPVEDSEQVVYRNLGLKASVGVMALDVDNSGGLLIPKIRLKNLTNKTVNAEIQVKFLDRQGFEIEESTGWDPLTFGKGEIKTYSKVATKKGATDYRFILKLAKN